MRRRVLTTDAQERSVLAAIRCLGAAGYSVTAVAPTRMAPGLWSRTPAIRRLAPDPRHDVVGFITGIRTLVQSRPHDILLAGTDVSLLAVSQHREMLTPYVRLGLPAHPIVQRALDKRYLSDAASSAGLAPPEARVCHSAEQALAAASTFDYPVLVKPVNTAQERGGTVRRWASVLARDRAALEAAFQAFGTCIVQRRAVGPIISFAGATTSHGLLGFVVSRYARTWPHEAGSVCFSKTISAPQRLTEKVQALLVRLQWVGLFELELVECGPDTYGAIDFNPRPYGSLSLAAQAGVPLTSLWCDWLLGENVAEPRHARVSTPYRWEDADLTHLVSQLRDGRLRSALAVAKPHRGAAHAYFRIRDPAPLVARAAQIVVNTAGRAGPSRRGPSSEIAAG